MIWMKMNFPMKYYLSISTETIDHRPKSMNPIRNLILIDLSFQTVEYWQFNLFIHSIKPLAKFVQNIIEPKKEQSSFEWWNNFYFT